MKTPINAETFLPQLVVDYLTYIKDALGLESGLRLAAWPVMEDFQRPQVTILPVSGQPTGHEATWNYVIQMHLDYGVLGDPAAEETPADRATRMRAQLTAENAALSLLRAALSLTTGQTLAAVGTVISFFDWITNIRETPDDEDGWALEYFRVTATGVQTHIAGDKRTRTRLTDYVARIMTNEFTV